ncbi:MAG: two-component sensor histidine kinase [Desulfuromonas sp.]|nr:MAG: two-component sensor histidine kinase [Desulfuromonas sp.]
MFFRSIRFRLTFWYALTLAVVLTASSLFWYVALHRNMLTHIDQRLLDVAKAVEIEHQHAHRSMDVEEACQGLDNYILNHNWSGYAQARNNLGNLLCSVNSVEGKSLPLTKPALLRITKNLPYYESISDLLPSQVRLLSYPVVENGRLSRILQVAESMEASEHTLDDLKVIFLMLSPFIILVLTLSGWFLGDRALTPIIQITDAARKITAEKLNERLPIHEPKDELANLSATINSMLARLEESFNRIKQFSGDASHELRTPLAILKGETEVALRWAKNEEELRQTLDSNLEEINLMSRILEDLLALAKSESKNLHLEIEEFSLSDLLQDIYMHAKTLAEPKKHTIRLKMQVDSEISILGDQIQLFRMLLNIVNNSIKYTRPGGMIEIILNLEAKNAIITVKDTGVGISEEHLSNIFERFYRVDAARNREDGGTGLGLSIVKAIIDAHGGSIKVESVVGEGSVFTITLPLEAETLQQYIPEESPDDIDNPPASD